MDVAGFISTIIALVEFSVKIGSRLKEYHDRLDEVPETFRILAVQIPLLKALLVRLKQQAEDGIIKDDIAEALLPVIKETRSQTESLEKRLERVVPREGESRLKEYMRALRSLSSDSSTKENADKIRVCIDVLTLQQTTASVEISADIAAQLKKLGESPLAKGQNLSSYGLLEQAISHGDLSSIRAMLHLLRANPDVRDNDGNTLLHIAARSGQAGTIKLLQNIVKDVNIENHQGKTALHVAIALGHAEAAKVLLECGARKDVLDDDSKTPLDYARQDFLTRWVIQHGPTLEVKDERTWNTALIQAACANEHVAVRQLLQQGAKVDATNRLLRTALAEACLRGYVDTINVLLSYDANPNVVDHENWTPFTRCIWANQIEALKRLVETDRVDINTTSTSSGLSAVNEAANRQCWDIVEFLLASGADPNDAAEATQGTHKSLLRRAAMNCNDDKIISMLLRYNAAADAKDNDGWTPMAEAIQHNKWGIMQVLLEAGADPNGLHRGKKSNYRNYPFIVRLAQWNCEVKYIRMLLHYGAKLEAVNNDGWTALSEAVSAGYLQLACELLELGANAKHRIRRFRGQENVPMLVLAMWEGRYLAAMVPALLAHGAGLEDATAAEWTALRLAADMANDYAACVLFLHGANPDAKAADGLTPAQVARKKRLSRFCALLDTRSVL